MNDLCGAAGLSRESYRKHLGGMCAPRPATLARLSTALNRFKLGFGAEARDLSPFATYRACLVIAAFAMKADPRAVLASDPSKRATLDPKWMEAARVRRVGLYIASQFLGFSGADLARAAGMSRQNVSKAVKELYDERDGDAGLDRVLSELERIFE